MARDLSSAETGLLQVPSLLGGATPAGVQALEDVDMVGFQAHQTSAGSSTVLQSFPKPGLSHTDTPVQKHMCDLRLKGHAGS